MEREKNKNGGAALRKRNTQMHQQMRHHQAADAAVNAKIQQLQNSVYSDLIASSWKALGAFLVVSASLILYVQPKILFGPSVTTTAAVATERLPGRTIVTLYPPDIRVLESLPHFFLGYGMLVTVN